jgi:hypothetical protein
MEIRHMNPTTVQTERYARCIEASRRIRWDIDRDVIRGRRFDLARPFLPPGLSRVASLEYLDDRSRTLLSQVQGRTYANMFGLVERFIGIKILQAGSAHWWGDQTALEALVRFADEEFKHQELFRRIERLAGECMPPGYEFAVSPNEVAAQVLQSSSWAVFALTCHIELFTQVHYRHSLEGDQSISELFKDVFLFHWKEESQHAILDELEWDREDRRISDAERDAGVDELVGLFNAVDGILQHQSAADARYFKAICEQRLSEQESDRIPGAILDAYRWQFIGSGLADPRFGMLLASKLASAQLSRFNAGVSSLRT